MIGEKISPLLAEIEATLWDFEEAVGTKPGYSDEGFRASIKIFMSAMLDKMYELQTEESLSMEDKCMMSESLGNSLRSLVKTYTNIDTHDLYV